MDIDAASPDNQNHCSDRRNIINDASDFEDEFVPRERQGGLADANNNHSSEEEYSSSDDDMENRALNASHNAEQKEAKTVMTTKMKEKEQQYASNLSSKNSVIMELKKTNTELQKKVEEHAKAAEKKQDQINKLSIELGDCKGKLSAYMVSSRTNKDSTTSVMDASMSRLSEHALKHEIDFVANQRVEDAKLSKCSKQAQNHLNSNPIAGMLYNNGVLPSNNPLIGALQSILGKTMNGETAEWAV